MADTALTPVVLTGTPSTQPDLVTFSELHQSDAFQRDTSQSTVAIPVDNPPVAPTDGGAVAPISAAPPPAAAAAPAPVDTSSIPGVALSTEVQGFIAAMALTAFPSGLATDRRAAVLNAITFCTMAANGDLKKDPTINYVAQWASYLPSCAFTMTSSGSGGYDAKHQNVGLDKALLDSIAAFSADVTSIGIMKDVINALETLPTNNGALTLFDHNAIRNGLIKVATTTVSEAADGSLEMTMTIYQMAFTSIATRVLWVTVNDTTSAMSYNSITATLNDAMLPLIGPLLTARLAAYYAGQIASVDLDQ